MHTETIQATIQLIPPAMIAPSPSNPRKTFDDIEELAADLKMRGMLQPVLVRPKGKTFELVFGERRWRAAKLAGLEHVPAMVRDLDDAHVLETQLVENCKRKDVDPLEEAEAYEQLHTKHGYHVEELAAKVGKTKAFVYARMKLLAMGKEARQAYRDGLITASTALLVARVPAKLQSYAVKAIAAGKDRWGNEREAMSYREAQAEIEENFMLRLEQAPFDVADAKLVPKAGACATCPKRTGNQPELFADVKSADVCTDPTCFREKRDAEWARRAAAAKQNGQRVLSAKEAKEVFPYRDDQARGGYHALDEQCWKDSKRRTYGEILKKDLPEVILARAPNGAIKELVSQKAADAALKRLGFKDPYAHERPPAPKKSAKEKEKERIAAAIDAKASELFMEALVAKAEKKVPGANFYFAVIRAMSATNFCNEERVLRRRGLIEEGKKVVDIDKVRDEALAKLGPDVLRGYIVEVLCAEPEYWTGNWGNRHAVIIFSELYGVDRKSFKAKARTLIEKQPATEKERDVSTAIAKKKAKEKK